MRELLVLGLRGLLGGATVCAFAAVSEVVKPKKAAGVFAAAPSVALASLGITAVSKGIPAVQADGLGMIAGAIGLMAYCLGLVFLLRRTTALKSALAGLPLWAAVSAGAFMLVAR